MMIGISARERMLRMITQLGRFTIRQLSEACGARYDNANRLVWQLVREGDVRCESPKKLNGRESVDAI